MNSKWSRTKRKHSVNYSYFISEQHRNTNAGEGDAMRWQRQRRVPSKIYKNQRKHWELKEPSPWRSKSAYPYIVIIHSLNVISINFRCT